MPGIIDQKFSVLESFPSLSNYVHEMGKIKAWIESASDWQLFRINPLSLAEKQGLDPRFAIDFFVHGSKIGLFDFQWNIVCPGCGGIEYSHASIGDIQQRSYHCTICNVDVPSDIDDMVEVAFSVSPSIRALNIDPFVSFESYRRFFFSENYQRSNALTEYSHNNFVGFQILHPDQAVTFEFVGKAGETYRFLSMVSHSHLQITINNDEPLLTQEHSVDLSETGYLSKELEIPPGKVTFRVINHSKHMNASTLMKSDFQKLCQILENTPNQRIDFFTAKMLLNCQSFKDLFRVHNLPKNFNLNVRSITLLFTDLKGSTQLYEKSGDIEAFHIVQEHFKILTRAIRENSGAIIKTMGDAVMAAFSRPSDAVSAAITMLGTTKDFWQEHNVPQMGIKIGIHEGPALAVTDDDRLDYFGQTVNVAARVQGQAQAGELVLSGPVFKHHEVASLLGQDDRKIVAEDVKLRGIDESVTIYRIVPAA